jgi:ankyrin repeat protein
MSTWRYLLAPLAVVAVATPAAAQFSPAYNFIKAVKDKDGVKAQKALEDGGSTIINVRDAESGGMALHIATRRSDVGWIAFLLQRDANPDVRDRDGATPMVLAATTGFSEAIRIFLLVKAQVDLPNSLGETALMKAVQARDSLSVRMLLDAGANPDRTDNTGASPRSYALSDTRGGPVAKLLRDAPARKTAPVQGPSL